MGFDVLYRNVTANRLNHGRLPQAFWRVIVWQLRSRLARGAKVTVRFVNHTSLAVSRGMTGATGNIYSGLDEPDEMGFLLHVLRSDDLFVDVGANVGVYSVLAAGVTGAPTIAFEPAPATFNDLRENLALNRIELKVDSRNVAIGATHGTIRFSTVRGPQNHVLREDESVATAVEVPIHPLDEALAGRVPTLLKIDVEGYEGAVLDGGRRTLESPTLLAVIMEIGKHTARYGHDEMTLRRQMQAFGFTMCRYDAIARTLEPLTGEAGENTIFVRDLVSVRARIAEAPRFKLRSGGI